MRKRICTHGCRSAEQDADREVDVPGIGQIRLVRCMRHRLVQRDFVPTRENGSLRENADEDRQSFMLSQLWSLVACMASASRLTGAQSSASAGVTRRARRWPSVSMAKRIMEPFLRLASS